ncbi:uncharacterized protein LOC128264978 [Drosophila gunungcola]|uniref:uncharacterized protein LOC128264978 n=1 Tax=Drosophila gunungcola TaxID=103775 RepID=UPI0022E3876E|nr:uncharacterized protein LOC128264978 [Drosophila gunungcola]
MGYAEIKRNYYKARPTINNFQLTSTKLTKLNTNIKFLLKCRKTKIIPKFIKDSTRSHKLFTDDKDIHFDINKLLDKHTHYYHMKILSLLIKHKHHIQKRLIKKREDKRTILQKQLDPNDFTSFMESEQNITKKLTKTTKMRQIRKLERLQMERSKVLTDNKKTADWFVNKTDTEFPPAIKSLLAKGPKFALPIEKKKFPLLKYIADGEEILKTIIDKEKQEEARTQFSLLIKDHKTSNKESAFDRAILDTVGQTRRFLKENDDILILTSDKENRYFKFENNLYTQLKGMPMGSPASPVIADIVMETLLDNTLEKLRRPPRLLTKYVDDLFAIIQEDDIKTTLTMLNSFTNNINLQWN